MPRPLGTDQLQRRPETSDCFFIKRRLVDWQANDPLVREKRTIVVVPCAATGGRDSLAARGRKSCSTRTINVLFLIANPLDGT